MTAKILCPWCGTEMEIKTARHDVPGTIYARGAKKREQRWNAWTSCTNDDCGADGPIVAELESEQEAIDVAIAAAIRRYTPPNRGCEPVITGETSDGYHTFNELYHHRAVLFSVIVKAFPEKAWKAKKHDDGSMYDGMFIVGVETPDGQATYHYDIDPYWEMFKCRELEYAPKWDGHTPQEAIERIGKLEPVRHSHWHYHGDGHFFCCGCKKYIVCIGGDADLNYCPNCGAKMDKEKE